MFVRKNEPQNPLPLVLVVLQLISKSVWSMAFFLYAKVRVDWHPIPELLLSHAPRLSHIGERETRVTGDEAQGTVGRRKKRREARFLLPAFFCLQGRERGREREGERERERETSGYETATGGSNNTSRCFMLLKTGYPFPPEQPLGLFIYRRYLSFFLYVQVGLECNQIPLVKLLFEESII